jgi:hypothetical protein
MLTGTAYSYFIICYCLLLDIFFLRQNYLVVVEE